MHTRAPATSVTLMATGLADELETQESVSTNRDRPERAIPARPPSLPSARRTSGVER